MSQTNSFKLAARNSLRVNQVLNEKEKTLLNTFKGGNDLRREMNRMNDKKGYQTSALNDFKKTNQEKLVRMQRNIEEALMQEVAALDNFKIPAVREKTKVMIQNIKIRRREKHIEAYNLFKQDLDDYRQNLASIYESLVSNTSQVLSIKETQLRGYLSSQTDQYLLSREKDVLDEISSQLTLFQNESNDKLIMGQKELQRIRLSRGDVVEQTCTFLREQLIDIAFVLQDEARQIEATEKESIITFEKNEYEKSKQIIADLSTKFKKLQLQIVELVGTVQKRWRTLKQTKEIQEYARKMDTAQYRNPAQRVGLFQRVIMLQQNNNTRKKKLIDSLLKEDCDTLNITNIGKWKVQLKVVNDLFDKELDELIKLLMEEYEVSLKYNNKRYEQLRQRLVYIGNRDQIEVETLLTEKCIGLLTRNNTAAKQLMAKATSYVQQLDERENNALQKLTQFIGHIAARNDQCVKQFSQLSQKYQLEKAKILDDDDELVDKLNKQLNMLKQQLKEALHHIKLEEVEKNCFMKIDQIQNAYRNTHECNKTVTALRPGQLEKFMKDYQGKLAEIFQLYGQNRRNQLVEKRKKETEELVMKKIEQQEKLRMEQESKQIQQSKKKGGKAPVQKPKDPKKVAAELEETKKLLMGQMGIKPIEELKTDGGEVWLVFRTVEEICTEFYKTKLVAEGSNVNQQHKQQQGLAVDALAEPIKDAFGDQVVTNKVFINIKEMASHLLQLRQKLFKTVPQKRKRLLSQSSQKDNEMLQQSLQTLDGCLKEHYSLKGKLETEIYLKRSGEITNHKKRYEKYARSVKQKMDLQTEKFNVALQKCLQLMKNHNLIQKGMKDDLAKGKNISQFQGMLSKARENSSEFSNKIKQLVGELDRLSNAEVDMILEKNKLFISQSKTIQNQGEYSFQEIEWYKEMIGQITKQVQQQKIKRNQKMNEIKEHTEKRRKQLIEAFEKDYHVCLEELSAKEGTGKKYGRPKRIAQEKIRFQMNKCEQAQISIEEQIKLIESYCNKGVNSNSLELRKILMTVQTCIMRYAQHLEALVPNLKIKPMSRVNYNQAVPVATIAPQNEEEDKKRRINQLAQLGPLSEQADQKPFIKYVEDVEKCISDQTRTIYVGDKAKLLTGKDNVPDFLRVYIANMRKNAQDFKQNSIRQLRDSCQRLANLPQQISQTIFSSILNRFATISSQGMNHSQTSFSQLYNKHFATKNENLQKLRPNLSNVKCQQQLKALNQSQKQRQISFQKLIESLRVQFDSTRFTTASQFLTSVLNNFQFLIIYYDSLLLWQDFVKVTGDDAEERKQLDLKQLMLMKQKGVAFNSSSERNLKKKWQGVDCTMFNFGDKKFVYMISKPIQEKQKDKKGAKKQAKDVKKVQEPVKDADTSKSIQTFKTWRHKSGFLQRQRVITEFKDAYDRNGSKLKDLFENSLKENESFKTKWSGIVKQLMVQ